MKITILDADTVSQNDISLQPITSLGETTVYGSTQPEEILERIKDSEVVICNKCVIDRQIIEKCSSLRLITLFATGYNNIDTQAAAEHGVTVCNVPAYSTDSVAQHTFSMILAHYNRVADYAQSVAQGDWIRQKLFTYFYRPIYELAGMTIGIVGFGDIGRKVAQIARAFGMEVVTYTRSPEKVRPEEAKAVSLEDLMKISDVVTLHCPLNEGTQRLINSDTLKLMKKTAILVNTSRGGVIDENDLRRALDEEIIAGAYIDVLTKEPMSSDCLLFGAKNCVITPHIAWAPLQTRQRLVAKVAENIEMFMNGTPINVVSPAFL
ncbi:MAG: D-2-hydroxyacid dehydrogenase [Clostridia bacterium]|nr:D-2-hydroxyacid dehydrogenase [Clostridia bacterium]